MLISSNANWPLLCIIPRIAIRIMFLMKMTMSCFKIITSQAFIVESKKLKWLKKSKMDTGGEHSGFSNEEEFVGSGKNRRTAEEKLKRSLFVDDEGPPLEEIAEE